MRRYLCLLAACAGFIATPVFASDQTEVMAVVDRFIDGFNKGDTKQVLTACGDISAIIDEFPPHEWNGPGACAAWLGDYDTDAKKRGITDGMVTLKSPSHVDVTGDRAYVVVPADYAYDMKGKAVLEKGSILTIAFKKGKAGWRMSGWTWSKH